MGEEEEERTSLGRDNNFVVLLFPRYTRNSVTLARERSAEM